MNENRTKRNRLLADRVIRGLQSRNMEGFYAETKEEALLRSVKISDGVQALVGSLSVTPAFVVAKGGITSSDIGVRALLRREK